MSEMLHVFTLHESENDFRVKGAVLARSPQEAASILGGEYIEMDNQPPGSSVNPDDLNLFGRVIFAAELFRRMSGDELSDMKLDFDPGLLYEKYPGLTLWLKPGEDGKEFVLRRHFVCTPNYNVH